MAGGGLSYDSPFMRALSVLGDLMILNIITIICCVPVVTAGASFTAMHYVLLKRVRGTEGYIISTFFDAFKKNLKKSIPIWLIMIAVYAALFVDWRIIRMQGDEFPGWVIVALYSVIVVVYVISLFVFPVFARYENTIYGTFKTAFSTAVSGFPFRTILAALVYILPFVMLYFMGYSVIPIFLAFCFSGPGFIRAALYSGIFMGYEGEEKPHRMKRGRKNNTDED
ncbi:MAG: YesL family protein [Lachnospiraceae bacterium]|nr:YesL family protein [Lachnospiraceae bacterium]